MPVSNPPVQPLITGTAGINTALSPDGTTLTVDGSGISVVTSGNVALGAAVRNSINTTIPNNENPSSFLTYDTVLADNGGFFSFSNPERLTIPANGWYCLAGSVTFVPNSSGIRELFFKINGVPGVATTIAVTETAAIPAPSKSRLTLSHVNYFVAGDYVVMGVFQNSGGDLDVEGGEIQSPYFSIVAVSAPPFVLDSNVDFVFNLTGSVLAFDNQSANTIFAGPVGGGNANPTFRSLVAADFPGLISVSGIPIYDDSTFKITGTAISFDSNLSVAVTGSTAFISSSGGIGSTGTVASDPIWSAKGQLAVGLGANSASALSVGANGTRPEAQSGQTTGIQWSYPPSYEVDYVQYTGSRFPSATTEATANLVISGSTVVFNNDPILIQFYAPQIRPDTVNTSASLSLYLYQDSASIGRLAVFTTPAGASDTKPVFIQTRLTGISGTHQFSIRSSINLGNSGTVVGGAGGLAQQMPMYIRTIKV